MLHTCRIVKLMFISMCFLWWVSLPARAEPVSWVEAVDGYWVEGYRWSTGAPPGAGDHAIITLDGTDSYTVVAESFPITVNSLTVGAEQGSNTQTLEITPPLGLGPDFTLYANDHTEVNVHGAIFLSSTDVTLDSGWYFVSSGLLSGNGLVVADYVVVHNVRPGAGPAGLGELQIDGEYSQTGLLEIELGGYATGSYDRVSIAGDPALIGGGGYMFPHRKVSSPTWVTSF